jgi:hypothetical protein
MNNEMFGKTQARILKNKTPMLSSAYPFEFNRARCQNMSAVAKSQRAVMDKAQPRDMRE